MLRTITVEIEIPGDPSTVIGGAESGDVDSESVDVGGATLSSAAHDEIYENSCHTLWQLRQTITRITNTEFSILRDSHATDKQLNDRWDGYTEGGSIVFKPTP